LVKCPKCGKEVNFVRFKTRENGETYDVMACEDILNCDFEMNMDDYEREKAEEDDSLIKRSFF
jgi:ssDNA-binding Zn-finger/Zn-ribbon topoisomerase 1